MKAALTERLTLFQDASSIQERVVALGKVLTATHRDSNPLVIGVIGGAFLFLADLVRTLDFECEVEFWRFRSYGSGTRSSGRLQEVARPVAGVRGRHVIVVEDIVDSGRTIARIRAELSRRQAASVTVVALLKKQGSAVPVDHVGFRCGPHFVVGYGLDIGGRLRNLPSLYYIEG